MTKKDITEIVSRKTGVSNAVVKTVIDEAVETVIRSITSNVPVYIRGLFTLSNVKRAKKTGQNIKSREQVIIPEHYTPHAKFSKKLRDNVATLPINKKK